MQISEKIFSSSKKKKECHILTDDEDSLYNPDELGKSKWVCDLPTT